MTRTIYHHSCTDAVVYPVPSERGSHCIRTVMEVTDSSHCVRTAISTKHPIWQNSNNGLEYEYRK